MSETLATDDLATRIRAVAGPHREADPSDCPICGEWRDSPTADCANCGWCIRPCGDTLGLCVYSGPHDGPHKFGRTWADRLAAAVEFGAAWQRAERALPDGWGIWSVQHVPNDAEGPWVATVGAVPAETPKEMAWAYGPTPAAALTALAEKLETGR